MQIPKGIRKAPPTKLPPTMRVRDMSVQVKVPPQRKQSSLVKHAAGEWEAASSGSDAESNSADSHVDQKGSRGMTRLRSLPGPPAKGQTNDVVQYDPQCTFSSARLFGHDKAEGHLGDLIHQSGSHGNRQNGSRTANSNFPFRPSASLWDHAR